MMKWNAFLAIFAHGNFPYMNILFLTYQGDIAGSTNSISYLAKGLAAKGHSIFMGCRKESLLYKMLENTAVHLVPMTFKSKIDFRNMRQIRDAVKKHNIQVINAQSSWDRYSSILARWIFRLPVKLVHTRRQKAESIGGVFQNLLYVSGTDKIIAVSEGVKESLIKKNIPEQHVHVIYNGTPYEKYQKISDNVVAELKEKYNIKPNDFVIGCVSRKKKQEQILQALDCLPFKVKLILVGIDEEYEYRKYLPRLRDRHEIFFTGLVSSEQVLNYYPLFTIKILASTIEGLSQSILESMALGIPVIATNCAGNPELIKHNVNGLLFRNDDVDQLTKCIINLHNEPATRARLSEEGKLTAFTDFSMEKTIDNHEKFFQQLTNGQ
jgi:L-malate glycosyltransferase